jgi:hypothetical protein
VVVQKRPQRGNQIQTKKVKAWTKVCVTAADLAQQHEPRVVEADGVDFLHADLWPKRVRDPQQALHMGYPVVIDFKPYETEEQIQKYLGSVLDLAFLKSDLELIRGLDQRIALISPKIPNPRRGISVTDLFNTALFRNMTHERQEEARHRVNCMIETETFFRSRKKYRMREAKASVKVKAVLQKAQLSHRPDPAAHQLF